MHPDEPETKGGQEFRLRIQQDPWQATLEPLPTQPTRPPHQQPPEPEQFSSPLDLLERLERNKQKKKGGVK